jgi:hypothetical protein
MAEEHREEQRSVSNCLPVLFNESSLSFKFSVCPYTSAPAVPGRDDRAEYLCCDLGLPETTGQSLAFRTLAVVSMSRGTTEFRSTPRASWSMGASIAEIPETIVAKNSER